MIPIDLRETIVCKIAFKKSYINIRWSVDRGGIYIVGVVFGKRDEVIAWRSCVVMERPGDFNIFWKFGIFICSLYIYGF